jgi:hypothetical protein
MDLKKWVPWNWFKNGVLTVTLPKKSIPKSGVRQIEVKSA